MMKKGNRKNTTSRISYRSAATNSRTVQPTPRVSCRVQGQGSNKRCTATLPRQWNLGEGKGHCLSGESFIASAAQATPHSSSGNGNGEQREMQEGRSLRRDLSGLLAGWETWFERERAGDCTPTAMQKAAFRVAGQQALTCLDPQVQGERWVCRAIGELAQLCFQPQLRPGNPSRGLVDLYERLPNSASPAELIRLRKLVRQRLDPLIRGHFQAEEAEYLEQAVRMLVMLRVIGLPYQPGCPPPVQWGTNAPLDPLLHRLHVLSKGAGLFLWETNGNRTYAVEEDLMQFVEWMITCTLATLTAGDWNKTLSDAVWACLFPRFVCEGQLERTLPPTERRPFPLHISGAAFPGREAIIFRCGEGEPWGLIFESPLEEERGKRARAALASLRKQVTLNRVLVWEPARPHERDKAFMARYTALARLLRVASPLHEKAQQQWPGAVSVLQSRYVWACPRAMRAILTGYWQGVVVGHERVWRGFEEEHTLLGIVERIAMAVSSYS